MPSHKIHIKIGEEINKRLNLNDDLFLIGCVLPDLSEKIKHYKSHFKTNKEEHLFYNIVLFVKEYDMNNPVLKGYLVHLLTDYYYNTYMKNNYFIIDKKLVGIKTKKGDYYNIASVITKLKQKEFTMYDYYLLNHHKFKKLSYNENIPKIKECDYSLNYIKEYIDLYNDQISHKCDKKIDYKILTQKELDDLFDNCIKFIVNYLENFNLIIK